MERLKTALVELPAWSFGKLNGIPSPDIFTKAATAPPRGINQIAADLMEGIATVKGIETDIKIIDPRFNETPWKLSYEDLSALLEADIVGGSALSRTIPQTIELFRFIKKHKPNVVTVLGGPHASAHDEEMIKTGVVDYVARGEADYIAIELWGAIKDRTSVDKIKGLSYRDKEGKYVRNPDRPGLTSQDLSALPLPYDSEPIKKGVNFCVVTTSLGCPFNCEFCAMGVMGGANNHRRGSMERAMQQMERCYTDFPNSKFIFFADSNFAPGKLKDEMEWVYEFLINVDKEYGHVKGRKRLMGQTDVHAAADKTFLKLFKKAGGFADYVGGESTNEATLKKYKKAATVKQNLLAMQRLREEGVWGHFMMIAGGEGDTIGSLQYMKEVLKVADSFQIFGLIPTPGSPLGRRLIEEEKVLLPLDEDHLENYSLMDGKFVMVKSPKTLKMSEAALQDWILDTHEEFLNPWNIPHLFRSLRLSPAHFEFDRRIRSRGQALVEESRSDPQMVSHKAFLASLPSAA